VSRPSRRSRVRGKGVAIAAAVVAAAMALPAATVGAALPDGRGYEMVSPPDKAGNDVIGESSRVEVSAGVTSSLPAAVRFASYGAVGDVRGTGISVDYFAVREGAPGTSGWATHAITPPQEPLSVIAASQSHESMYAGLMSDDLTTGVIRAWSPLTDTPNVAGVVNLYLRDDLRTPGEGSYELLSDAVAPLPPIVPGLPVPRPFVAGASVDFRHVVFEDRQNLTADATGPNVKLYKADDGVPRLVSDGTGTCPSGGRGSAAPCSIAGLGANVLFQTPRIVSADGSRVNFTAPSLFNGNISALSKLYQLDDQGTPALNDDVVVQLNASEKSPPAAPQTARYQTASTDGTRVFFTSSEELTDTSGSGLYMWERQPTDESQSVTVDATGGSFTLTAQVGALSATTAPLPAGADEVQVQAALAALRPIGSGNVEVTGGPGGASPYVLAFVGALSGVNVPQLTTDGSGLTGGAASAAVATTNPLRNLTLIAPSNKGVLGASDDGHRVYFAGGLAQLVPGGPPVEESALYLWQDVGGPPSLSYIGGITSGDANVLINQPWSLHYPLARVTPDGRHLAFEAVSGAELAPAYQHGTCGVPCEEIYAYSADSSGSLTPDVVCASCNLRVPQAPGDTPLTVDDGLGVTQRTSHMPRVITDDGRRVFFSTDEPLVPEDVNAKFDAYEYDVPTRTVRLISSGTDSTDSFMMDASADGYDAYFVTRQRLVGWDRDDAYDLYDARVGGGFPEPPPAPKECAGDACQGQASSPPTVPLLGSSAFKGLGDLRVGGSGRSHTRTRSCKRGRVRKHVHGKVRCFKRTHSPKRATRAGARRAVR
jgi:hypothetical protein